MRARSTPPKLEKRAPKVGGFAADFACGFFEFWKGGMLSRIVFLEVFARGPLILSDDNRVLITCAKHKGASATAHPREA